MNKVNRSFKSPAFLYKRKRCRKGMVSVEAAIVAPVLVLLSIAALDVGQYINLSQTVCNASREGARAAAQDETLSIAEVESVIETSIKNAFGNVSPADIEAACQITVCHGDGSVISNGDLINVPSGQQIMVEVVFDYSCVRWIGGFNYWNSDTSRRTTYSRRE